MRPEAEVEMKMRNRNDLIRTTTLILLAVCFPILTWSMSIIYAQPTVRFAENDSKIESQKDLLKLRLAACAAIGNREPVIIEGHASRHEAHPEQLAKRRADAVADVMVQFGADRSQLRVVAFGAHKPLAPEEHPAGQAKNRRVDVDAGVAGDSQECWHR
ncbi:OmpA family protein [Variovorax sp. 553]|jgi:outer membrane protein OmpA-like peptidoglycan-associated protein|nr:OmpA family protein [Variovorax sp. 553]RSZ45010.1 OmpA family protein [Variovorax sp. 679]